MKARQEGPINVNAKLENPRIPRSQLDKVVCLTGKYRCACVISLDLIQIATVPQANSVAQNEGSAIVVQIIVSNETVRCNPIGHGN